MADPVDCDNPDLWCRMKSAKEVLFNNEQFSNKYRSPPSSPTEKAFKSTLEIKPALEDTQVKDAPASGKIPSLPEDQNTGVGSSKPGFEGIISSDPKVEGAFSPAMAVNTTSNNFRALTSAPSTSSNRVKSTQRQDRPPPCIPLTLEEDLSKRRIGTHTSELTPKICDESPNRVTTPPVPLAPKALSIPRVDPEKSAAVSTPPAQSNPHKVHLAHAPHISSPLANEFIPSSSSAPSQPSVLEDICLNIPRIVITPVETQAPAKMPDSDETDEIVCPPRGGSKPNNTSTQDGSNLSVEHRYSRAQNSMEPFSDSLDVNKYEGIKSEESGQEDGDWQKGVTIPKENRRDNLIEDEAAELERLRKEIVVNAHRARLDDNVQTASPEMLPKCRDGPGTDRFSAVYHDIGKTRLVPQDNIPDYRHLPGTLHVFSDTVSDKDPTLLKATMEARLDLYREFYKKTPRAFPTLADENIVLSPVANNDHKKTIAKISKPRREMELEVAKRPRDRRLIQTHDWADKYIVDWEYCPREILDRDHYRAQFQCWLDDTIQRKCLVDIYHQTFFDGTAHADGENSMFILDMRNYETLLQPSDRKARHHAHETAAGYAYNLVLHCKKAAEAEHHRREMNRRAQLEALQSPRLRSPSSPIANIYLRPVEDKDVPELQTIYDWYARNSVCSPNTRDLDPEEVRQRIETCRSANLPFIVAIQRRSVTSKGPERILGYALAREFDSMHLACRNTAELELYVKDGHTNQGIGKCLLDKLLEVCDPTYVPKSGYQFEANIDDRGAYFPGGRRRLGRLVFTLCYIEDREIAGHKRVKKWLAEHAEFEEQGLLRGVRVKWNKFVNVAYLVRNVGYSQSNTWEP